MQGSRIMRKDNIFDGFCECKAKEMHRFKSLRNAIKSVLVQMMINALNIKKRKKRAYELSKDQI